MANRIIIVTGDREGVGKTTLAVNIAARLSFVRKLPVVVIDSDPLSRGDAALAAGATPGAYVSQMLEQLANKQVTIPMLRGRVSPNRLGVGVLQVAPHAKDADKITPEQWRYFLQGFSQLQDVVIDIETVHRLQMETLDVADAVVWCLRPDPYSLGSALQNLENLYTQKFSFHHFLFALNQADLPNALSENAVNDALAKFHKELDILVPVETDLLKLLAEGKSAVITNPRTAYHQSVAALVDRIGQLKRASAPSSLSGVAPKSSNGSSGPAVANAVLQNDIAQKFQKEKTARWNQTKTAIHRELVEELNLRRVDLDTKGDPVRERQLRTSVESTVNGLVGKQKELDLTRDERENLVKELVDEALGLGPLEELLRDPTITEIMVNRFDQVFVERRGKITLSDKKFIDNNHVIQVVRRIIAPLGRRIDESVPLVDARLRDGSRVNAIIPPLAVSGPSVTIRRFPERAFSAEDLARINSISPEMVEFLRVCVLAKKNIIIAGGTGTGKTTILNVLSAFIPNNERIVTVEDTAELRLQQEHVVRLEARPANMEGQGQVAIRDLVKNCLRMRPDRIVVGECRAGEALDMLQAMNTGHDGSLTTIHANSPRDAFTRLETLCLMAGMDLPVWALREQIRSAIQVLVQLSRLQDGSRRVTCVTEVIGRDEQTILTQDLFRFVQEGVDEAGVVQGHFETCGKAPSFIDDLKSKGLAFDPAMFKTKR